MSDAMCPEAERLRIACVGDSLTRGDGLHEHIPKHRVPFRQLREQQHALRERGSYPAVLSRLAATRFADVRNFGHGGATACNHTGGHGPPYLSVPEFSAALRFSPHALVVMLGTNDAKPAFWSAGPCGLWGRERGHGFRTGLLSLIHTFCALSKPPKLILLLSPPSLLGTMRTMDIDPDLLREARAVVAQVQAREDGHATGRVILMHAAIPRTSLLFSADGIHFNADGSALLACAVHAQLRRLLYMPCGRADGSVGMGQNRSCFDPFCVIQSDGPAVVDSARAAHRRMHMAVEVVDDASKRTCVADSGFGAPLLYTGMACTQASANEPDEACETMAAAFGVDLSQGLLAVEQRLPAAGSPDPLPPPPPARSPQRRRGSSNPGRTTQRVVERAELPSPSPSPPPPVSLAVAAAPLLQTTEAPRRPGWQPGLLFVAVPLLLLVLMTRRMRIQRRSLCLWDASSGRAHAVAYMPL